MSDIFGQDIALDEGQQPKVAASGELLLSDGVDTGLQDILLRLRTPLGSLFYDTEFGSLLHEWTHEESTQASRMALEAEVRRRVAIDPRVQPMSVTASVAAWDEKSVTLEAGWKFVGEDHRNNLVIEVGGGKIEVVKSDVHPG
ncbi:baseplate assembly protein [Desulfocurvibacter africanus]|uniref:baseplate assembly protein n=1 Tax=Desulfocurvibacter africanus TaxID=873 RepID=UPI002FD978D8